MSCPNAIDPEERLMKRILLLFTVLAWMPVWSQDIIGTWSGEGGFGSQKLPIVFHIAGGEGAYTATMDSPMQGAKDIPVQSVAFCGDTLRIDMPRIGFVYTGVLKDGAITGNAVQRGRTIPLDLTRGGFTLARPQEPVPPFPYRSEDVYFENREAGIRLAGTFTCPAKGRNFPAVVLITGSGAQNRDEELFGHKPFLVIADYLTRRGIAVLRFDDRGFAQSEGDLRTATTEDFASDALAAVEYLKTRREVNKRKIGLAGHSEGGTAAFMAAARQPADVAFVVSMAGAGLRGDSISLMQIEDIFRQKGLSEEVIRLQLASQRKALELILGNTPEYVEAHIDEIAVQINPGYIILDEKAKEAMRMQLRNSNTPWGRFYMTHDTPEDIRAVRCPVLAVNGGKDLQVRSSAHLSAIAAALEEGGNSRFETREYPGLNHLFQHTATGAMEEYGDIEETWSPEVLEDIAEWIVRITR